jgi:hypothetical protein
MDRAEPSLFGKSFLRQTQPRPCPPNVGGEVMLDLDDTGRGHLPSDLSRALFRKQPL